MADETEAERVQQDLHMERLISGDRPSIMALGVYGAESIKRSRMAVFMVDILGRVHVMPPDAVEVKKTPRVGNADLDQLEEGDAINALLLQGDEEKTVIDYLRGREERKNG
jgi:hypothetical protein